MKNTLNRYIKYLIYSLALIVGAGLWSCEEDESDKISVSPQRLPTVSSVDPVSGVLGTTITITGTNFSANPEVFKVKFNGVDAEVTASTETSITTTVPPGATSGTITITVGNSVVQGGPAFTVPFPTVASYSPTNGISGTSVVITGTNFSSDMVNNAVNFNGTDAVVTASTPTTITTTVPFGAVSGPIEVTVDGQSGSGPDFTIPFPTIASFDPMIGETGAVVTITGTNFSSNSDDNEVSFNGVSAVITSSTTTSIVTSVPPGSSTGPIAVSVGGQTVTTSSHFTVTATTLVVALDSEDDDVEEVAESAGDPVGTMDLGSSDLELGEISSGQGLMNIGLRFNNITIPAGAVITEANIQFNADNTGADPVELTIYGENVGNAAAYTGTDGELSARPLTTASSVWSIPEWVNKGDRGDDQKTVDLAGIIQEIVNRGDWASGNSLNIIMQHTGVSVGVTSSSGGREAENYSSSDPEHGAELTVKFTQ